MEGNSQKKDGTDNAHIRPVSSLLSHFENLSHRRAPSAATNGTRDTPSFLRTLEPGDDVRSSSRASLDLSRSHTPWDSTPELNRSHGSLHGNGIPPRPGRTPGVSPGRRQDRPMSLSLHSSPQLPPTLTVDSPRSPPRGFGPLGEHEDHVQLPRSPLNPSRESLPTIPQGGRPTTPVTSRFPIEPKVGSLSPGPTGSMTSGRDSPQDHHGKSASLPPPVNRVDKPKIPVKPAALSHHDGGGGSLMTPQPERAPVDDRISPFSTPPSSPEKDSPKQNPPTSSGIQLARSPSRRSPSQPPAEPPRYRFEERTSTPQPPLFREPSFTQRHSVPEPPRETRPLSVQIPPRPSLPAEPLSAVPLSANRIPMHDGFSERPGLPPRQPSVARRGGPSPSRLSIQRESSVHSIPPPTPQRESRYLDSPAFSMPPPTPNRESRQLRRDELPTPTTVQRHPSIARENRPGPPPAVPERPVVERPVADRPVVERQSVRVHSEDEQNLDSVPVARNDYPDASTANRRPPLLKSGPMEINTRYDTRLMDVCGKHVCTTGYITRVWDLTTGEQLMSLSHGETVKSLSLAFKPGVGLEDEGQRVWLGTNSGELHEVDIATGSIVASRSYPSRKEVVKILRHKKEMWTLDDEGRLLVWPPDENGTPNLQYSYHNPYDRVARGHTFSMVVGDKLWLAAGKEVHVYRPNARDDISFKVLSRPLGAHHTGDVTSGAYTTRDGGLVYLGHSDGKVTVYSAKDYACLAVVNVSVYKINCLGIVGDYLWAAYKTGMIYVYDTSTNPWTVKKDWRAHDSPVSGFLLDSSSVWTMNRLQVTSLGDDNCIRLWDGMLEDDWLETRMQTRDVEFCNFREIHAAVITWNAGASTPGSVRTSSFIQDAIHPENPPEIIVFGFQELVDLENKKITAKSLLLGSKKKDSGDKEHMSRQYRVWMEHLTRCINDCMPLEESYVLLHSANMIGLFTCVFVKHKERQRITDISASEIKRGMGGLHGNKGALLFRFTLDDSSICLVNCHLAAGQTQTAHRNNDIAAILEAESLPAEPSLAARANRYVSGGDGSMIMDHEICILNGDLNYRIDAIPRNVIIDAVRSNNLTKLLERDQLLASRRKNPGFRLRSFNESPITFAPTYKYDVGTDEYDSSDKKRAPAWCDRVLYRGLGRVRQLEYRRHEVRASDHRPVSAAFKFRIKTVLPSEREAVWEACQQEFSREKRRLASEASIEYLITVLGTEPQQARSLIMGKGN